MRAGWIIILALSLMGVRLSAQQSAVETSRPEKAPAGSPAQAPVLDSLSPGIPLPAESEVVVSKRLRASGPLVHVFSGGKASEVPRRLVHLVNPFAKSPPKPEGEGLRDISPRAWTTIAGWNPGGSAFADPVTHEPSLSLISLNRSK